MTRTGYEHKTYKRTLPGSLIVLRLEYEHDEGADLFRVEFTGELLRTADWALLGAALTAVAANASEPNQ